MLGMLKERPNETIDERKNPGDPEPEPCAPGSIEQQLDMCETGTLRGDEILHSHGAVDVDGDDLSERGADIAMGRYETNMSERDREGSEESGDDHSSGYQGYDIGGGEAGAKSGNGSGETEPEASSDYLRRAEDENVIPFPAKKK